jgi:hypothetical protein
VCGLLALIVGAVVYLSSPWVPEDLHSCIMKAMGGIMMARNSGFTLGSIASR